MSDVAPPVPYWPQGWYIVSRSTDLPIGAIRRITFARHEIIIARLHDGAAIAMDAHCPHMGAHLQHATVTNGGVRCALHGFTIDHRGKVGGCAAPIRDAVLWDVFERCGMIFVAFGTPRSAVPEPPAGYEWSTGTPLILEADWRNLICNAFDMPHLRNVHRRELREPVEWGIDVGGHAFISYKSRVTGRGISDLLMKRLSGDQIRARMTCSGPVLLVESDLGFTRTAALLGVLPGNGRTQAFGAFGMPAGRFRRVGLLLTRWLFMSFLRRDFEVIEGMRFRTDVDDPSLQMLFGFLRSLPAADAP